MHARNLALGLVVGLGVITSDARALPPAREPGSAPPPDCSIAGTWAGTATDDAGTRWTFPMQVRQTGTTVEASITWSGSNGHGGEETARGRIGCATRRLEMQTVTISGEHLAAGAYHATVAADWRSLQGSWDGPGVIPGRFAATRR